MNVQIDIVADSNELLHGSAIGDLADLDAIAGRAFRRCIKQFPSIESALETKEGVGYTLRLRRLPE